MPNILQLPRLRVAHLSLRSTDLHKTTQAAAHGSPTGSQKATGVRSHTQKSAQHQRCRRKNTENQYITRVTSKNVNRPQTHVARSQDHPVITYNTLLGHFSTASHRSNTEVLARSLIGTCLGLSSSRTLTTSPPLHEWSPHHLYLLLFGVALFEVVLERIWMTEL